MTQILTQAPQNEETQHTSSENRASQNTPDLEKPIHQNSFDSKILIRQILPT
jgi:hypothetical protein